MKINANLFNLTSEQEKTSQLMYSGKTIKCLVAPYHTYSQLEKVVPYSPSTFLFPEKELSLTQLRGFISMVVASKLEEVQIITTNQNIIMDMVGDCVRVLTEDERIVDSPIKTFMANIHDIRYSLLENEAHQISKEDRQKGRVVIQELITKINSLKTISTKEKQELELKIKMVGEEIISDQLLKMLNKIPVV